MTMAANRETADREMASQATGPEAMVAHLNSSTPSENTTQESEKTRESAQSESSGSDSESHETPEDPEDPNTPKITEKTDIGTWLELSKYITAYHPSALEACEEQVPHPHVHLTCDICQVNRLRLPWWVDGAPYVEDHESEDVCVLPCGHFFGSRCMAQWMGQERVPHHDTAINCPKCRFSLLHAECEHPVKRKTLRDMSDFEPDDFHHLVPNTGVYILGADGQTFIDISVRYPEDFDADHNFGVPGNCRRCERRLLLEAWDRDRKLLW